MAREYSVWKTTVAALQFWTVDLKAHVLSSAIDLLYEQLNKILFGHFMTTLCAAFGSKLTLEDEDYECSSEKFNIPTPLLCNQNFIYKRIIGILV